MKGTELNFLRVSDIWHRIYFANICKKIFVILEVQFHHVGASVQVAVLNFLLGSISLSTMLNFIFYWGPLLPFWDIFRNLDKFCLLNNFWFFFCSKSGSYLYQFYRFPGFGGPPMGVKMSRKWTSALALFFYAQKSQRATLTCSAMVLMLSDIKCY